VRDWLKAGILDEGVLLFPEAGTPQGGIIPFARQRRAARLRDRHHRQWYWSQRLGRDPQKPQRVVRLLKQQMPGNCRVRFRSGGGVGDRHADHNWAALLNLFCPLYFLQHLSCWFITQLQRKF
jgi:hypothetical protein